MVQQRQDGVDVRGGAGVLQARRNKRAVVLGFDGERVGEICSARWGC